MVVSPCKRANADSARQKVEEERQSNRFPELSAIDISDEALEYLIKKGLFERQHPVKNTRQVVDKRIWEETMKKPGPTNEVGTAIVQGAKDIKQKTEDNVALEGLTTPGEVKSSEEPRTEFDDKLDPAQHRELEEIRARRQRQRNVS